MRRYVLLRSLIGNMWNDFPSLKMSQFLFCDSSYHTVRGRNQCWRYSDYAEAENETKNQNEVPLVAMINIT